MKDSITKQLLTAQYKEITEYQIYNILANRIKDKKNESLIRKFLGFEI